MDMSPQAIKSLLSRARCNLREALQPYLDRGAKINGAASKPSPTANSPSETETTTSTLAPQSARTTQSCRPPTIHNPNRPLPTPPEELVAYLDGELSPDECRRVEERLAGDADYRQQLRDLDQAWEALDALPAASAGDDFARTTIEMVTVAAQDEQSTAHGTSRRDKPAPPALTWPSLRGAAVRRSVSSPRAGCCPIRTLACIADLPVIRQMDLLAQIEDVDFLRQLSQRGAAREAGHRRSGVRARSGAAQIGQRRFARGPPAMDRVAAGRQKADLAAQAEADSNAAARAARPARKP